MATKHIEKYCTPVRTYFRVMEKTVTKSIITTSVKVVHDNLRDMQTAINWLDTYKLHDTVHMTRFYYIEKVSVYSRREFELFNMD